MSAVADQVLAQLETRAFDQGVSLDRIDEFLAAELSVPLGALYAYLLVGFAAERYQLNTASASSAAAAPSGGAAVSSGGGGS